MEVVGRDMEKMDLGGRTALVIGIANEQSLAWAAARHFRSAGARIAITFLNEKARPVVEPLARLVDAELFEPCDFTVSGQLQRLFERIGERWGRLDTTFHSVAFARREDLHCRLADTSAAGFSEAMLVSCHSFIQLAKLSEPLMTNGGSLTTLSFVGAERVVDHYNIMGPVKAALEASVRYLAYDLGKRGIRVNAISAGPVRTRAASGIEHFDELVREAADKSPLRRTVSADEVGKAALMLASSYATAITGEIIHVDAGFNIEGMVFH